MKVTLLIPTLNEMIGMKVIMPQIDKLCQDYLHQILFIDGGSTDGTIEWIKDKNYDLVIQKRRGLKNAYQEALEKIKGDYVITFSPDGNSLAESIPALINEAKKGFDMVIASRYKGNAKSKDDDILTRFGNFYFTKMINFLFQGKYTDAFIMLRIYKTQILTDLDVLNDNAYDFYDNLLNTHLGVEPLLSVRCLKAKLKISEIPMDEPARIGGERKLQIIRWGIGYTLQIIREIWFWKKN